MRHPPLTYRRTVFHFDDMNDLLNFLVAADNIDRDKIESLELTWESRADCESEWNEARNSEDPFPTLKTLHARQMCSATQAV